MAKSSGSIRNNRRQAITERGFSRRLERNILERERSIRNNRDESLHFFDSQGNEVVYYQGRGAGVSGADVTSPPPTNAIITHNHPRSLGRRGVLAIGNSFSLEDLTTAINTDAQEIRAVTPTYMFTMKRSPGGWGVTPRRVIDIYTEINDGIRNFSILKPFRLKKEK